MKKPPNQYTGAHAIVQSLVQNGVKKVFIYPGGTIAPILNVLEKETNIEIVCPRNEQGAGYAALGAAKVTGEPQIVMVTSGPGVTNVLTPVADAYYDSVPLLVFTGQVATKDINTKKKIRQTGFQEVDTTDIFRSVTKKTHTLRASDNISKTINDLFLLTKSGRQGPVLIDLPMDVQRSAALHESAGTSPVQRSALKRPNVTRRIERELRKLEGLIRSAKRPVIVAGNGIYLSDSVREFRSFVERYGIPVVCSLPGIGTIPSDHPLCFSYIGHTGEYFANLAVYHSDLVIGLGARFDLRQTGSEIGDLKKRKTIVRVDIDERELKFGRVRGDVNVHMNLKFFFRLIASSDARKRGRDYSEWIATIKRWKEQFHSSQFYNKKPLYSYDIVKAVDKITARRKLIVTTGVGGHQQMAARYFTYDYPVRRWLTSSGHGAMGYDLPSMVGAMLATDKRTLGVVFVGDGSFQMNIQELATIHEHRLPVKIFVLDNRKFGVVSQFQLQSWGSDPGTGNKRNPPFSKVGAAYGLKSFEIRNKREIAPTLRRVFQNMSPAIIHCHIHYSEDTLPMLLGGQKMNEMHPFAGEA